MGLKIGVLIATVLLVFAFPLGVAAAHHEDKAAPAKIQISDNAPVMADTVHKDSAHILEWAVFGIAVGEFAGIMGRGLSQILHDRRTARKNAPESVQPVNGPKVLLYAEYKARKGRS